MADAAQVTFFSALRRGAALGIARDDFSDPPANRDESIRARLAVKLSYDPQHTAVANLALIGPGDIVGLDTRTVVRMFPRPDDNDAEAGFLAYLEIDQPDLPWRYTPARMIGNAAGHSDKIRPWFFLLVLREGAEVADGDFRPPKGVEKLPQLAIRNPDILPSLDDAWGWSHVQAQGTPDAGGVAQALAGRSGPLVARVMSPRRLDKQAAYRAFLVPTFKRGAKAGRGEDPGDTDALATTWPFDPGEATSIPVYHSWRFQTGTVSSFSEAARALRPSAELPATVGLRDLDVSAPGFGLPSPTGNAPPVMPLGGALQTRDQALAAEPTIASDWTRALAAFVDLGKQTLANGDQVRVVTPPLYGRWYAAETHLDRPGPGQPPATNPPWFSRLNSDPRYRVAAALGTEVVQRDQQGLMASAWDQASRLEQINRTRRVMQMGREIFVRILERHIATGTTATIFTVTSPVCGRVLCSAGGTPPRTVASILDGSVFGGCLHPPWRRAFGGDTGPVITKIGDGGFIPQPENPGGMATPPIVIGGAVPGDVSDPDIDKGLPAIPADQRLFWGLVIVWVARALLVSEGGRYFWLLRKLLRLGLDLVTAGATNGDARVRLAEKLRSGTLTRNDILTAPKVSTFTVATRDPDLNDPATWPTRRAPTPAANDGAEAAAFRTAVAPLLDYLNSAPAPGFVFPRVNVPDLVNCVLAGLAPRTTFTLAERSRHIVLTTLRWQAADPLEPLLIAPEVGRPMWESLRDLSPEWILPGLGDVPRNTVSLVKTSQRFIESFMVGLNGEMTRELTWNGYPTDQRGTYFRQFWDSRGWVKEQTGDPDRGEGEFADVDPIAEWEAASALGDHSSRPPSDHLVLLVRGDIIKRYPNVIVYAAKATKQGTTFLLDDTRQKHPVFSGLMGGDSGFYGFELDEASVRGGGTAGDGWFFVLQEHPSEPKFNQFETIADNALPSAFAPTGVASDIAAVARETPLRVAIHGKDLLPAAT